MPCTCRRQLLFSFSITKSNGEGIKQQQSSNLATTSKIKLEDDLVQSNDKINKIKPFQSFYPIEFNFKLPKLKTSLKHINRSLKNTQKSFSKLNSISAKLSRLSSPSSSSSSSRVPLPPLLTPITTTEPIEFPEYLPLIIRERNYLLSILRQHLYSPHPSPKLVWNSLVATLSYPTVLPNLPSSSVPLSILASPSSDSLTTTTEGNTFDQDYNRLQDDSRRRIQLSLLELRRSFTILAKARPFHKKGLAKLLVVVELLAQRNQRTSSASSSIEADTLNQIDTGGIVEGLGGETRNSEILQEFRGGGTGLREKDWIALINFASFSYRSVRPTIEVESATSLFSQWSRNNTTSKGVAPVVSIEMYNTLLNVATEARAWDLFERIEDRMVREKVEGDAHTVGIKLKKDQFRGINIQSVWSRFIRRMERFESHSRAASQSREREVLWNSMVWILLERGLLEDGMRIYNAMKAGQLVSLGVLGPRDRFLPLLSNGETEAIQDLNPFWILPPRPTIETYQSLIQVFTLRGDLKSALRILRDIITPLPPSISTSTSRCNLHSRSNSTPLTPTTHQPNIKMFINFFKGFVHHAEPIESLPQFDNLLLSGTKVKTNSSVKVENFAPLLKRKNRIILPSPGMIVPSTNSNSNSKTRRVTQGERQEEDENPWNFKTLQSLTSAFLNLTPPPLLSPSSPSPSTSSSNNKIKKLSKSLPFESTRTAPSAQDLFWFLLAFEKVTPREINSDNLLNEFRYDLHVEGEGEGGEGGKRCWESRDEFILEMWEKSERVFDNDFRKGNELRFDFIDPLPPPPQHNLNTVNNEEEALPKKEKKQRRKQQPTKGIWTGYKLNRRILSKVEELRDRVERGRVWREEMGLLKRKESAAEVSIREEKSRVENMEVEKIEVGVEGGKEEGREEMEGSLSV